MELVKKIDDVQKGLTVDIVATKSLIEENKNKSDAKFKNMVK